MLDIRLSGLCLDSGRDSLTQSLSLSSDQKILLGGEWSGYACLYNIDRIRQVSNRGELKRIPPQIERKSTLGNQIDSIINIDWMSSGINEFECVTRNGFIHFWNTESFRITSSISAKECISCACLSTVNSPMDDQLVCIGTTGGRISFISKLTGKSCSELTPSSYPVTSLSWSTSSPFEFVSGSANGELLLWDIRKCSDRNYLMSYSLPNTTSAHAGSILSSKFSSNSKSVLSCGTDSCLRIWNKEVGHLHNVYNLDNSKESQSFEIELFESNDNDLFCCPTYNGSISMFSIHGGRPLAKFSGHMESILSLKYSNVHSRLFTSGMDNIILIWNVCENIDDEVNNENFWDSDEDDESLSTNRSISVPLISRHHTIQSTMKHYIDGVQIKSSLPSNDSLSPLSPASSLLQSSPSSPTSPSSLSTVTSSSDSNAPQNKPISKKRKTKGSRKTGFSFEEFQKVFKK